MLSFDFRVGICERLCSISPFGLSMCERSICEYRIVCHGIAMHADATWSLGSLGTMNVFASGGRNMEALSGASVGVIRCCF